MPFQDVQLVSWCTRRLAGRLGRNVVKTHFFLDGDGRGGSRPPRVLSWTGWSSKQKPCTLDGHLCQWPLFVMGRVSARYFSTSALVGLVRARRMCRHRHGKEEGSRSAGNYFFGFSFLRASIVGHSHWRIKNNPKC